MITNSQVPATYERPRHRLFGYSALALLGNLVVLIEAGPSVAVAVSLCNLAAAACFLHAISSPSLVVNLSRQGELEDLNLTSKRIGVMNLGPLSQTWDLQSSLMEYKIDYPTFAIYSTDDTKMLAPLLSNVKYVEEVRVSASSVEYPHLLRTLAEINMAEWRTKTVVLEKFDVVDRQDEIPRPQDPRTS